MSSLVEGGKMAVTCARAACGSSSAAAATSQFAMLSSVRPSAPQMGRAFVLRPAAAAPALRLRQGDFDPSREMRAPAIAAARALLPTLPAASASPRRSSATSFARRSFASFSTSSSTATDATGGSGGSKSWKRMWTKWRRSAEAYLADRRDAWSWYRFWQIREKFWDGCTYLVIGSCVLCSAFSLFEVLRLQRNNIQRMWIAYVRKERERSELMEIVKQARAAGLIPPADNEMQ